jgi:hypothetical protein
MSGLYGKKIDHVNVYLIKINICFNQSYHTSQNGGPEIRNSVFENHVIARTL